MSALVAAGGLNGFANDIPLLTLLIAVPVIGAIVLAFVGRRATSTARNVALVTSGLTALLALLTVLAFDRHNSGYQFQSHHTWFTAFGVHWTLAVDGISIFLVALSALMFPIAIYLTKLEKDFRAFAGWMLVLEAGCIGSFMALDLFLFFVFFEVVLIPMYFLIIGWGGERRGYAALKFFLYTFVSSAVMLIGIIALVFITSHKTGGGLTFDFEALRAAKAYTETQGKWIFFAFALAFAVKTPLFPVHTWSPVSYEQAPIASVVVSTAVMVKLGTYGFVRFCVSMFPDAAHDFAPVLMTLAVIGMTYGAIVAAVQKDLRRLLAYSSISNLGFIVLGTFVFSHEALSGAVLQMVNHGLTSGALFLLVAMLYARTHTTRLEHLGGLQKAMPVLAAFFVTAVMSSIGVPGLNGFIGEFLILSGSFVTHRWWAVAATSAVILAAVYLLWAYQQVFHGPMREQEHAHDELANPDVSHGKLFDLKLGERLAMVPLIALIVFIGVYPKPALDRIEPSVKRLLNDATGEAVQVAPVVQSQAATNQSHADQPIAAGATGQSNDVGVAEVKQ